MSGRAKRVLIFASLIALAFLVGFVPQYFRVHGLQRQVQDTQKLLDLYRVSSLSGMTFLQTSLKNYGLASRYATEFFDAAKGLAAQTPSPQVRETLQAVLAKRDAITAQLARGDQAAYGSVQAVYQSLLERARVETP